MTKRTRYFLVSTGAVLIFGLAGGLIAYLRYNRAASVPADLPAEVRYVPANAEMVAYANVKQVLNSELHRELVQKMDSESRKGRQMMNDFAGVDLETQVDHVVMYVEPLSGAQDGSQPPEAPQASLLVRGSFDQGRIEQFIRDRDGVIEEYKGRKIFAHETRHGKIAVGFLGPGLISIGSDPLVRRAIDLSSDAPDGFQNVTTNAEMMNLIRDTSGSTAWAVGQFDAVSRRMRLPSAVTGQVPPVRLISAKADIDGGVKATIRAETGDKAAADQLRDVVRGFITLARMQASDKPGFESALKSIELSGTDRTVQMSFAMRPDTLRALAPYAHRERQERDPEQPNPEQPKPERSNPER
jgi:hypothetical protein